jgi:hypothetical protein
VVAGCASAVTVAWRTNDALIATVAAPALTVTEVWRTWLAEVDTVAVAAEHAVVV